MSIYRPRAICHLHVPLSDESLIKVGAEGDVITIPIRPRRLNLEFNDHNNADTASFTADWRDVGIDPRFLKNATCEIYLGDSDEHGRFTSSPHSLRFIGVMTRPKRSGGEGAGLHVE